MRGGPLALFDCDGTLVDSQAAIVAAMREAFLAHGFLPPGTHEVHQIVGLNLEEAMARLLPPAAALNTEAVAQTYRLCFRAHREQGRYPSVLYPGIKEALEELGRLGIQLGIATGKSTRGITATLAEHSLAHRFVTLHTPDGGRGKPHPDMVLRAIAETGSQPGQVLMVGDTSYDVEMAQRAGVGSIAVTWGYHDRDTLAALNPDAMVSRRSDLPGVVSGLLGR